MQSSDCEPQIYLRNFTSHILTNGGQCHHPLLCEELSLIDFIWFFLRPLGLAKYPCVATGIKNKIGQQTHRIFFYPYEYQVDTLNIQTDKWYILIHSYLCDNLILKYMVDVITSSSIVLYEWISIAIESLYDVLRLNSRLALIC